MSAGALAGAGVFIALAVLKNGGVLGYLLKAPCALDSESVRIILANGLLPLCAASSICLLAWGSGLRLLRILRAGGREDDDVVGLGLGLGALGSAAYLMGVCGLFNGAAFAALGAAAGALGCGEIIKRIAAWKDVSWHRGGMTLGQGVLAGLLAYLAWHALITALAPPTQWDVLAYHLALPKLYLRSGRIIGLPWLLHSHWPHLMETLYAAPLSAGMDNAAALLHASACAALVLATYRAGRKLLGPQAAWIGAALLAAQPVMLDLAGTAHSDGAFALFHFLACATLWSWAQGAGRGRLAAAGLLSGLAASTKLLGLVPFAVLSLWVLARSWREKRWGPAAIFTACGLAVVLPWLLTAWIRAGNPFWPFLSGLFGGRWGASYIELRYLRSNMFHWPPEPGLVLLYGPQFLLFPAVGLALCAALRRAAWPPFLKFLLMPALFYFPAVARHHEGWRFMLPMMPALALSAGYCAQLCAERAAGRLVAAALLLFGLSPVLRATENNQLFAVLGLRSASEPASARRDVYLGRSLGHYLFYRRASALAGQGAKILLFREIRGYYLDADYMWGDPLNQGLIRYAGLAGPGELAAQLARLGVTHVLINEGVEMYSESPDYYDKRTLDMMGELLRNRARPLLRDGGLALYQLTH